MTNLFIRTLSILHWVLVVYALVGWAAPTKTWLLAYLIYVPAMVVHWSLNGNVCIVNSIETWLATGKWRAPDQNPEEGAFIITNMQKWFGWAPQKQTFDIGTRVVLAILWIVAFWRWWGI